MRDKNLIFLAGLPRSGSSVLSALISQNPHVYCSPTSILIGLINQVDKIWNESEHSSLLYINDQYDNIIKGLAFNLYSHINQFIIIDKNRAWAHPHNLSIYQKAFKKDPKIICTVRNIPDILSSFIKLIEQNPSNISFIDNNLLRSNLALTNENRCKHLMSPQGHVFQAWSVLKQGFDSNFKENMLFVEYEDLVSHPSQILIKIYEFLDIDPYYKHDINNIPNTYYDDESVYNLPNLHYVRSVLQKDKSNDPLSILGNDLYHFYSGGSFWRSYG